MNSNCHHNDPYSQTMKELLHERFDNRTKSNSSTLISRNSNMNYGWLPNALEQLEQINEEAAEENFPAITPQSILVAKQLLDDLGEIPLKPTVYPSMDSEISIFFKSLSSPSGVLILINNDQQIFCYSSINDQNLLKEYNKSSSLPDEYMKNMFQSLA